MIAKLFAPLICYLFGHDKIHPYVNHRIWSCVRCENGPADKSDRMLKAMMEDKK